MADMKIGDDVFNVELGGDRKAPPLVISNSLGTNLSMWDAQMPALNRRFRTIRYDSRGHGASAAPDRPYSIAELAADALALMDALEVDKAHWLGLSKGGMVGQWLLTHHRNRIDRAVLANTAAHMGPPNLWNDRIRTVRDKGMKAITPAVIERWFTKGFRESGDDAIDRIAAMLHATPAAGYAGCCAAIRDMDQREGVRSVTNPVLVIVGKHDPATPPEAGRRIADAIPGAKLKALDAAHLSNVEQPDVFTRAVVDFLSEKTAASRSAPAKKRATTKTAAGTKTAKSKTATKAAPKTTGKTARAATRKAAKKASANKAAAKRAPAKSAKPKSAKGKTAKGKTAPKAPVRKAPARKPAGKGKR